MDRRRKAVECHVGCSRAAACARTSGLIDPQWITPEIGHWLECACEQSAMITGHQYRIYSAFGHTGMHNELRPCFRPVAGTLIGQVTLPLSHPESG